MGFHSRRSSSRCICSCKECFSPSIWLKLICSLPWTWKRICKFTHLQSPTCSLRGKFYKQFEFVSVNHIVCLNHAGQPFTFTIEVPQQDWKIIILFGRRPDKVISNFNWEFLVVWIMYSVHVPDSQHRKLDAKTHKTVFLGYPPGVKGYVRCIIWRRSLLWAKMFNSLKRSLIILMRRLNQMMLIKQNRGSFSQIKPRKWKCSRPVTLLPFKSKKSVEPAVQEKVKPAVQENVKTLVGAPPREHMNEEEPVRRTFYYEDAFMEKVRNLGPVRQQRMQSRFQGYDCLHVLVGSEIDEPSTVHEAL